MTSFEQNIVLIGMPGAGKSTVGVLLAKRLSMGFIDTDLVVQAGEGRHLQDIIGDVGVQAFRTLEERYACSVQASHCIIATGGSVVYSQRAMEHLGSLGTVVFLDLELAALERRVTNLPSRGVVRFPGQSFEDLYRERRPLYLACTDVTVQCEGKTHEEVAAAIEAAVEKRRQGEV